MATRVAPMSERRWPGLEHRASGSTTTGSTNRKPSKRSSTPPWPLHEGAEVLHVEVALEHALGEVAERGEARRSRRRAAADDPVDHVSLRRGRAADDEQHEEACSSVPPIRPSIVLPGLIQPRSGDLPIDEPTSERADVVGDDAEDDHEQGVGADVVAVGAGEPDRVSGCSTQRRISAAYEPSRPIHTMPIVVTAMFGSGPDSTPRAPMKPIGAGDEGERDDERQPAARRPSRRPAGRATHAARPGATAGRYPFSVTLPKYSKPAMASRRDR